MRCSLVLLTTALVLHPMLAGGGVPTPADVEKAVKALDPTLNVGYVEPSALPGLYRASVDGSQGYISTDGKHFIVGDMYDVATRTNLSEESRKKKRLQLLRSARLGDGILFAPATGSYDTVTVFTDVDCGYCRKLHSEIAKINEAGIAIRYVAYPRSGPESEAWNKMEAVWCASDRKQAMSKAKLGENVAKAADCKAPAVAEHFAFGEQVGVMGTPTLLLQDGTVIGGYVPLATLVDTVKGAKPKQQASQRQ